MKDKTFRFTDHTGVERQCTSEILRQWHAEGRVAPTQLVRDETTGQELTVDVVLDLPRWTGGSDYEMIADKIGFVPNVRKSDNVYQAKIFGICWLACLVLGAIWGAATNPNSLGNGLLTGIAVGGLGGMVVALLVSGTIVGFKGMTR